MIFDSKLQWSDHIAHAIKRSTKALNGVKLIRIFFTQNELNTLAASNFFSILYYNSEIWQLPSFKATLKQKLLSSSAKALRVCLKLSNDYVSFETLHRICKRAAPIELMLYKMAICLFKVYNNDFNVVEFAHLNFNQVLTGRQTLFETLKSNKTKVGLNALANRFFILNNTIPLKWFNMSLETYKVHCKKKF